MRKAWQTLFVASLNLLIVFGLGGCASPDAGFIARAELLEAYGRETPARPVLVVDIDDTLVDGGAWNSARLFLHLASSRVAPFPHAPESLRALEERWNIVLLTVRDDSLAKRTLDWLERQGFPETPVIFSRRFLPLAAAHRRFKAGAIAGLKEAGLKIEYGVGDKATDIAAYLENGVRAVLILNGPRDGDLDSTLKALGVEAIPTPRLALLELTLLAPEKSWEAIVHHLNSESVGQRLHWQ